MALIVETGSGLTNSESYASEAYADAYHENRGNAAWDGVADKEAALRKATDYMVQRYNGLWQGLRVNSTQALDWPRVGVIANGYYVLSSIVPAQVANACAELALRSLSGPLLADLTRAKTRTKIDAIEVEYDKNSDEQTRFVAVDAMLKPLMCSGSKFEHRLVR